jgi:hypothetical protein
VLRDYALAGPLAAQAWNLRADFFGSVPETCLPFEGPPAMDAEFAIDAVAVVGSPKLNQFRDRVTCFECPEPLRKIARNLAVEAPA